MGAGIILVDCERIGRAAHADLPHMFPRCRVPAADQAIRAAGQEGGVVGKEGH